MKKITCWLSVLVMLVCTVGVMASTEQERKLEYSLSAIDDVTTLWCTMGDVDHNWSAGVEQPFVNGVAQVTIDLAWGPALYRAASYWEDENGYALFSSYGSVKKIESGVNYLDFPMYISYWRNITFTLPGVPTDSEVWVNGSRAWFDGEFWNAYVPAPWNLTSLNILWAGHGQWVVSTDPTFDYGKPIILNGGDMDPSVTVPSQAYGISYLGDLSWPNEQKIFVSRVQYDETIGAKVLVCDNTFNKGSSFKLMVTLQNYDPNLGEYVQYFSRYMDVNEGVIMVPLIDNSGNGFGIPDRTYVRFVYEDPLDGVCKQQGDFTLYYDSNSGGGGKGE